MARQERGQASVELVAAVPILLIVCLTVAQLVVAGFALWSAGNAAHAGARAQLVGGDTEGAALSVLPGWLKEVARIETGDGVTVEIGAPALLPGLPAIPVRAATTLDPLASDDE